MATRISLALLFAVVLTSSAWAAEGPADQAFRRGLDAFERPAAASTCGGAVLKISGPSTRTLTLRPRFSKSHT